MEDSNRLWWRDGVIYQIYPRSFADSNGDGIGDLNGITAHLDYLAELGVEGLWLSPINPSPDVDFGYDVSDYLGIDPKFGTMADFERLVAEAHRRGIHLIMDLVLNHTSDQHAWFQASRASRDNPYRDYYLWQDVRPGGKLPNNWASVFGGQGWELDALTGQVYFHMFCKEQPDVNWRNPNVRQAMLDVFRFWLDKGVDGFRLDVFNCYFKAENLADNPRRIGVRAFDAQVHLHDIDQPELMPLLGEIRAVLDGYPERYVVGETFLPPVEKAAQYVGTGKLHGAFDFEFLKCPWNPARFLKVIRRWDHAISEGGWPTYVLNNHDNPRSATRYGRGENDERLKVAAALNLTLRGTPFLYYGEEIGMRDIRLSRGQIMDPVGKRYWPFHKGRDGCRAPMQWDAGRNAGFGEGQPWLPPHPDYPARNVAAQQGDPDSLLNFYRRLIHLRRETPALVHGLFLSLNYDPRRMLAYLRKTEDATVLVALNFGRRPVRLALSGELSAVNWRLLLSNRRSEAPTVQGGWMRLDGEEALILGNGQW